MTKYIIELENDIKYLIINGRADNRCYTLVRPVAELEILNSDYINENFGGLQDAAYQQGLNDAKEEKASCQFCMFKIRSEDDIPCKDCCNRHINCFRPMEDDRIEVGKGEPCIIDEQTRQALNSAISVLSETMDRIKEKLEIFNG